MSDRKINKRKAIEIGTEAVKWLGVTLGAYLYWVFVLLLASLFLLQIWHVTFEEILILGGVLTAVTSLAYFGYLIYRRVHGNK